VSKQKIVVLDNDTDTCDLIRIQLETAGFDALCTFTGREAISAAKEQNPSLMLLDVMLPEMDGFAVLREVRRFANIPAIMVTAKSDEFDKVLGLEMGADDYITKPFSNRELLARVKAVLRRISSNQTAEDQQVMNLNGFYMNLLSHEVRLNNQHVDLTPKEFDLLWYLASNRERVFTREQLLKHVWDYENQFFGDERTVDQHVKRLRRKVETTGSACRIATIWGVGYKFELS
jgi:DNA-binding response OmpR family regulator